MTLFYACIQIPSVIPKLEDLANLGHFLTGIAAFLAFIWATQAWSQHQKIKRSQAATKVLSKFRRCVLDILDIGLKPGVYQYLSYKQPIRGDKDEMPYPERPPRLIEGKIDQLNWTLSICCANGQEKDRVA